MPFPGRAIDPVGNLGLAPAGKLGMLRPMTVADHCPQSESGELFTLAMCASNAFRSSRVLRREGSHPDAFRSRICSNKAFQIPGLYRAQRANSMCTSCHPPGQRGANSPAPPACQVGGHTTGGMSERSVEGSPA